MRLAVVLSAIQATCLLKFTARANGPCIGPFTGLIQTSTGGATSSALSVGTVAVIALAVDRSNGDVFLSDETASYLRVIHPDGSVAVFAGTGAPGHHGDGGPALLAAVNWPQSMAVLPNGDVVFSEASPMQTIRRVRAVDATIETVAGNATCASSGDGGPASLATLNSGQLGAGISLGADGAGNIYLCEPARVRRISAASAIITTVAGTGVVGWSGDGGPALAAELGPFCGLAVLPDGSFYIADGNTVRAVSSGAAGIITSLLGSATTGPRYGFVTAVAADADHVYFARTVDSIVQRIRLNDSVVELVAGIGVEGYSGDDGPATLAALAAPTGLALLAPFLYIAESLGTALRRVDLGALTISRFAGGTPPTFGTSRSAFSTAIVSTAFVTTRDAMYTITSYGPPLIEVLNVSTWEFSPIAGNGLNTYGGDGGSAAVASFQAYTQYKASNTSYCFEPWYQSDLAVSPLSGSVYLAETYSNRIRTIDRTTGIITTLVGNGLDNAGVHLPPFDALGLGSGGADPRNVAIGAPVSMVSDAWGNLFFSYGVDMSACVPAWGNLYWTGTPAWGIALWNATTGRVGHIACNSTPGYSGDGGPATAAMCCSPYVSAVDAQGNVYWTEVCSHVVRVWNASTGLIGTVAGTGGVPGFGGDGGPATAALLNAPYVVRVDASTPPQLFVNDYNNGVVRLVGADGIISTIAGNGDTSGAVYGDGGPATSAALGVVTDIWVDEAGNLLVLPNYVGAVHAVVLGDWIACPVGYACPCATPIGCSDPASYCPGNTLAPLPVADGYFSQPSFGGGFLAGQAPCPLGSFCLSGRLFACLPGTYGNQPRRSSSLDCARCPPGTYSAEPGATSDAACVPCAAGTYSGDLGGAAFCLLCPPGTYSPTMGAAAPAACVPCDASLGEFSSAGAAACFIVPLGQLTPALTGNVTTVEMPLVTPAGFPVVILVALPVGVCGFLLFILLLLWVAHKRSVWKLSHGAHGAATAPPCASSMRCLRSVDAFSLRHAVEDGGVPVRQLTALGGAMTLLAATAILTVAATLIIQHYAFNTLEQRSVLPMSLELSRTALAMPPSFAADADALAPYSVARGVGIQLRVAGPGCSVVTFLADAVSVPHGSSGFTNASSTDARTLTTTHSFECADCMVTALSTLAVMLPATCQSVTVLAAAVSSEGVRTFASYATPGTSNYRTSPTDPLLASLNVAIVLTLETHSPLDGITLRGHRVAIAVAVPSFAPNPAAVTVTLSLSPPTYFLSIVEVQIQSPTQLLASLAGLLGILGLFGAAFHYAEQCVESPQLGEDGSRNTRPRKKLVLGHAAGSSSPGNAPLLPSQTNATGGSTASPPVTPKLVVVATTTNPAFRLPAFPRLSIPPTQPSTGPATGVGRAFAAAAAGTPSVRIRAPPAPATPCTGGCASRLAALEATSRAAHEKCTSLEATVLAVQRIAQAATARCTELEERFLARCADLEARVAAAAHGRPAHPA